jgi:hypothetical protein
MKKFTLISEAIPISAYRDVMKQAGDVDYKSRYNELFNGQMRIYIPLSMQSSASKFIHDAHAHDYEILTNELTDAGYENIDFGNNTVCKGRNVIRMGKAIEHVIDLLVDQVNDNVWGANYRLRNVDDAYSQWQEDNKKESKLMLSKSKKHDQLMVVISRHPYDVASMSTGRDWKSCMNLFTGHEKEYVPQDIIHGTIIAYVTSIDDMNLTCPLGRILIKPFFGPRSNVLLKMENRPYPYEAKVIPEWIDTVKEWVEKANANSTPGKYKLPNDLYPDDIDLTVTHDPKVNK